MSNVRVGALVAGVGDDERDRLRGVDREVHREPAGAAAAEAAAGLRRRDVLTLVIGVALGLHLAGLREAERCGLEAALLLLRGADGGGVRGPLVRRVADPSRPRTSGAGARRRARDPRRGPVRRRRCGRRPACRPPASARTRSAAPRRPAPAPTSAGPGSSSSSAARRRAIGSEIAGEDERPPHQRDAVRVVGERLDAERLGQDQRHDVAGLPRAVQFDVSAGRRQFRDRRAVDLHREASARPSTAAAARA